MSNQNFGAEFWLHNGTQLAKLEEVLSVTPSNPTRGAYQDSHHGTTGGAHTYKGEALLEPGTLTVRVNYLSGSDTDELLLEALLDPNPRSYKSVHNGSGGKRKVSGFAILTGYQPQDMPITGKQEAVLTFQASGAAAHGADS